MHGHSRRNVGEWWFFSEQTVTIVASISGQTATPLPKPIQLPWHSLQHNPYIYIYPPKRLPDLRAPPTTGKARYENPVVRNLKPDWERWAHRWCNRCSRFKRDTMGAGTA